MGVCKPDAGITTVATHDDLSADLFPLNYGAELVGCRGGDEPELDLECSVNKVDLWDCDEGLAIKGDGHGVVAREVPVCAEKVERFVHFGLGTAYFGDDNSFVERNYLRGSQQTALLKGKCTPA